MQLPIKEQCPVIFVDIIHPPTTCVCGSHDFIAHVQQHIQIHKPLEFITVKIELDKVKINN